MFLLLICCGFCRCVFLGGWFVIIVGGFHVFIFVLFLFVSCVFRGVLVVFLLFLSFVVWILGMCILFCLLATSGPQLVYQRPWYVLFCLWKSAYKRFLAAYRKE